MARAIASCDGKRVPDRACCGADHKLRSLENLVSPQIDRHARLAEFDNLLCDWTGFSQGDVAGHRLVDLVAAPQRRHVAELVESVMRESVARELPLTLLSKRGEELSCAFAFAPVVVDSAAHGAVGVCFRPSLTATPALLNT
jgi:hypothetical protein